MTDARQRSGKRPYKGPYIVIKLNRAMWQEAVDELCRTTHRRPSALVELLLHTALGRTEMLMPRVERAIRGRQEDTHASR